jgi:hypothetical protein
MPRDVLAGRMSIYKDTSNALPFRLLEVTRMQVLRCCVSKRLQIAVLIRFILLLLRASHGPMRPQVLTGSY